MRHFLAILVLYFLHLLHPINCLYNGFTFWLGAGRRDCFHEVLKINTTLDLEYQVVEGGELDVDFELITPQGLIDLRDSRKSDEMHTYVTAIGGEFTFCFDNSFSLMTEKLIYVDLGLERSLDDWPPIVEFQDNLADVNAQDIVGTTEKIKTNLDKASTTQNLLSARKMRHTHLMERNKSRVFWWSLISCSTMIFVGVVQVILIKNLFKTREKVRP